MEKEVPYYNHPLMFQPQYDWISDHDGEIIIDFIGRFENFQEDFNTVCKKLNIKQRTLPQQRKSKRNLRFQDYYDDESKKIITKKFQKDLDFFKYTLKAKSFLILISQSRINEYF